MSPDAAAAAAGLGLSGPPSQSQRGAPADPAGDAVRAQAGQEAPDSENAAPAEVPADSAAPEKAADTAPTQPAASAPDAAPTATGTSDENRAETAAAEAPSEGEEAASRAAVEPGAGEEAEAEGEEADETAVSPAQTAAEALGLSPTVSNEVGVTAGGGESAGSSPGSNSAEAAGAAIPSYVVAVLDEAPPFSYTGRFGVRSGFDVDLASALCRAMRARCTLTPMPAEEMNQALADRRAHFAVATPTMTVQPASTVAYSQPYVKLAVRYVTPRHRRRDVEDDEMVYAAIIGTAQAEHLTTSYSRPGQVRLYPSAEGMWVDLVLGRLDGVLTPAITARREFLSQPIGRGFGFTGSPSQGAASLARSAAIGLRPQETELASAVNAALQAVRDNGDFDEIIARHLDRDLVEVVDEAAP